MSWLEDLEARLEQQLEQFLQTNPTQEALLADQARRDRLEQLRRDRLALQGQAEQERQALLNLAAEIQRWQERVQRAQAAGAGDLATRAEAHVGELMERGRQRWQTLAELGQRFSRLEAELEALATASAATETAGATAARRPAAASGATTTGQTTASTRNAAGPTDTAGSGGSEPSAASGNPGGFSGADGDDLDRAWAAFEAEQELEQLKRRMQR